MRRKSFQKMHCPIARWLKRVGDWWTILILRDALHGYRRFDEFREFWALRRTSSPRNSPTWSKPACWRSGNTARIRRVSKIVPAPARARFQARADQPDGVRQQAFRARGRDGAGGQRENRKRRRHRRVRSCDRTADRGARLRHGAGPGRDCARQGALRAQGGRGRRTFSRSRPSWRSRLRRLRSRSRWTRARASFAGPIVPTLFRMAWPNVLVMFAQAATGLIETFWVGMLGTDALAGIALVCRCVMLMQMMSAARWAAAFRLRSRVLWERSAATTRDALVCMRSPSLLADRSVLLRDVARLRPSALCRRWAARARLARSRAHLFQHRIRRHRRLVDHERARKRDPRHRQHARSRTRDLRRRDPARAALAAASSASGRSRRSGSPAAASRLFSTMSGSGWCSAGTCCPAATSCTCGSRGCAGAERATSCASARSPGSRRCRPT